MFVLVGRVGVRHGQGGAKTNQTLPGIPGILEISGIPGIPRIRAGLQFLQCFFSQRVFSK